MALKITEGRAGAAVTGDLLIVKPGDADSELRCEVLHHRKLDMELGAGLIVRIGVLPVEGEAGLRDASGRQVGRGGRQTEIGAGLVAGSVVALPKWAREQEKRMEHITEQTISSGVIFLLL